MPRSRDTTKKIISISGGLVTTATDLVIITTAFAGGLMIANMGARPGRPSTWKVPFQFTDLIFNAWSQSKFRRALGNSVGKGLVERLEESYRLTPAGRKRLKELLPSYKKSAAWDGRLWLVIYDIPEDITRKRDKFREFLEQIGCRKVQESVWLSVKDPRKWVRLKIDSLSLQGKAIVSCLGKDGSLGEENVIQMISRVFGLRQLNQRYAKWLKSAAEVENEGIFHHGLKFLAILRDDPVLPPELLPENWTGEKAFNLFEKKFRQHIQPIGDYL
jgi:phenylacetic acid degradation operon negative regulatory protein